MSGRAWLVTFADLAGLLLAFFAMALSMTAPESRPTALPAVTGTGRQEGSPAAARASKPSDPARFAYLGGLLGNALGAWPPACRPRIVRTDIRLALRWSGNGPDFAACREQFADTVPVLRAIARLAEEAVVRAETPRPVDPRRVVAFARGPLVGQFAGWLGRTPIALVAPAARPAVVLEFRRGGA